MDIKSALYDIVKELLDRGYTVEQVAEPLGVSSRTLRRWKSPDEIQIKPARITPAVILGLSKLLGTTCQDVATRFGFGFLYADSRNGGQREDINLFPLAAIGRPKNVDIANAVGELLQGRQSHSEGNLSLAKRRFEDGVGYALRGGEPLLAIYGQLFFGNLLRMTGKTVDAEREFRSAGLAAREFIFQHTGNKSHQMQMQIRIAERLEARAEGFQVILDWSKGNLTRVITEAPKVLDKLRAYEDYSFMPHIFYFLARAYSNLEQPVKAFQYAEQGLETARRLDASYYKQNELFLDHPAGSGHQHRIEHLLDLETDLHILDETYRDAETIYLSMRLPNSPATSWSLHNWFYSGWQEYIQHRRHLHTGREALDSNLDATFEMWRNEVASRGHLHAEAIATFHYGRTLFTRRLLNEAERHLRRALQVAEDAKAEFTAALSSIELIYLYADRNEQGDRELANDLVNMLYGKVETLRIPLLTEKYSKAREVASNIR